MPALREHARAKVNLTLHVLGRRADGYHELDSLVVFADLADKLALTAGGELALDVTGPRAADCGSLDDNLVLRAARQLQQRVGGLKLGRFVLDKHLPAAAGIGGGSADAAAALRLLATANGLAFDDPRMAEAARATGADVPVCLLSRGCTMAGVGERMTPLPVPRLSGVLINPGVPVATKDVFAAIGLKPGESFETTEPPPQWPAAGASAAQWLKAVMSGRNDLEEPAMTVQPVIADVLRALRYAIGCRLARMSGSGATCFGLFDDDATAQSVARALKTHYPDWWIEACALS